MLVGVMWRINWMRVSLMDDQDDKTERKVAQIGQERILWTDSQQASL